MITFDTKMASVVALMHAAMEKVEPQIPEASSV